MKIPQVPALPGMTPLGVKMPTQPSLDLGDVEKEFSLIGNDHQTRLEAEEMRRAQVAKQARALTAILTSPTLPNSKEIDPAHVASHFQISFVTGK